MKKIIFIALNITLLGFSSSCKHHTAFVSAVSNDYLFDKTWTMETFGENNRLKNDVQGRLEIFFASESKQVNGHAGCNRFFGNYTLTNGVLKIFNIGTTKKLCSEDLMTTEKNLLKALEKADAFDLSEKKFQLKRGNKILATFSLKEE